MATAKKPAAGAKKASPAKSKASPAGRASARGAAGASAKSATKAAGKTASKAAAKPAAKTAAKAAANTTRSAAKAPAKAASKRAPNPAFMKPLQPDAQLAAVVGSTPMPRTQVVAKVWEYIKKNNLQQSRNISADDKLRPIFGKDQITMFEMMKLVNAHLSDASA